MSNLIKLRTVSIQLVNFFGRSHNNLGGEYPSITQQSKSNLQSNGTEKMSRPSVTLLIRIKKRMVG